MKELFSIPNVFECKLYKVAHTQRKDLLIFIDDIIHYPTLDIDSFILLNNLCRAFGIFSNQMNSTIKATDINPVLRNKLAKNFKCLDAVIATYRRYTFVNSFSFASFAT